MMSLGAFKWDYCVFICVQENLKDRPMMAKVVSYLNSLILMELPLPQEASFMNNDMNQTW